MFHFVSLCDIMCVCLFVCASVYVRACVFVLNVNSLFKLSSKIICHASFESSDGAYDVGLLLLLQRARGSVFE